jgi:methionyl-tRNA synthetase
MAKSFYVTTPIYYVNDAPHIGHAYTTVAGDVLTRWHRLRGEDVWFLTGTDEHGQKVLRTAEANKTSPKEWCDRLVESAWKPVWSDLNIANDDFIRTTEPRHVARVQRFLQSLMESGHIYEGRYEGPYCVGCEEFKLESDLDEGNCKIHGKPAELISESNWFFKLSAFTEQLLERYRAHPESCQPESARNEVIAFLEGGVQDLSISRSSFSWGIPVPWDENQVVYVWFDALLNYATAVGLGEAADSDLGKKFSKTWPANVHLVGKDILRFHAVIWPAMLLAAGQALPEKIFAHGWLLVGGEKMSKSKLTGIAPSDITSHFGVDAFRYYFLRAIPFGSDGSFSWEDMSARYTSELANDFGNLASRTIAMIEKYSSGKVSTPTKENELARELSRVVLDCDKAFTQLDFQGGINSAMSFCKRVNGYITEEEPWVVAKDPARKSELDEILYNTAESLRALATLLYPVMPATCENLWSAIGANALGELKDQRLDHLARWGQLPQGVLVKKLDPLFPRLEERSSQ